MAMINLRIDGQPVEVPAGTTILKAARTVGINIPSLCYHPDLGVKGNCRICAVEVAGSRTLQTACSQPVALGMEVRTNSPEIREFRRINLELILASHPQDCLNCSRNRRCELQALADKLEVRSDRFPPRRIGLEADRSTPSIVRDSSKCILCRRCVAACHQVQEVGVLYPLHRGAGTVIAPEGGRPLAETSCVLCGQCIQACPVGAIQEVNDTGRVWAALADPELHVVVQTAPAVRVAIGEELGLAPGSIVTGKLVAALKRLGFDRVFDTDFTADLTIMEEGHELLERIASGGVLPLITSCSPGWVNFAERFYPEFLPNLSTCKSPQQMFGALAKTYYAERAGIDASRIRVVSIMPCTAKKYECVRPELADSGFPDVDIVLTTRELGRMIRESGLDFAALPEAEYDQPLGLSTGAGVIFGATGGVMEAALRTVSEVATGKELPGLEFKAARGMRGVKEAMVDLEGTEVRVAIAHGLANARLILDRIKEGSSSYHFIEVMCCPGGCIGGGGQPFPTNSQTRRARMEALYEADRGMPLRRSHLNPAVQALYAEFLERPLSDKAHHLLHTHYTNRKIR